MDNKEAEMQDPQITVDMLFGMLGRAKVEIEVLRSMITQLEEQVKTLTAGNEPKEN